MDPMNSPVRFSCDVAVGEPADRVTLMVGTTGTVFVEGPSGLTATLGEEDAKAFAQVILARVGACKKEEAAPVKQWVTACMARSVLRGGSPLTDEEWRQLRADVALARERIASLTPTERANLIEGDWCGKALVAALDWAMELERSHTEGLRMCIECYADLDEAESHDPRCSYAQKTPVQP